MLLRRKRNEHSDIARMSSMRRIYFGDGPLSFVCLIGSTTTSPITCTFHYGSWTTVMLDS